jgi:hypothetical protein
MIGWALSGREENNTSINQCANNDANDIRGNSESRKSRAQHEMTRGGVADGVKPCSLIKLGKLDKALML